MELRKIAWILTFCVPSFSALSPALAAVTPSKPFYAEPVSIPGYIEAFEFDRGGEGVAYHVMKTPRPQYTSMRVEEKVVLQSYSGEGGGFMITRTHQADWVQFSVEAKTAGDYQFEYGYSMWQRQASSIRVEMENRGVIHEFHVRTDRYSPVRQWSVGDPIHLEPGTYRLRVSFFTDYRRGSAPDFHSIRVKLLSKK